LNIRKFRLCLAVEQQLPQLESVAFFYCHILDHFEDALFYWSKSTQLPDFRGVVNLQRPAGGNFFIIIILCSQQTLCCWIIEVVCQCWAWVAVGFAQIIFELKPTFLSGKFYMHKKKNLRCSFLIKCWDYIKGWSLELESSFLHKCMQMRFWSYRALPTSSILLVFWKILESNNCASGLV
jgi:hypothetical protein